MPNQTKIAGKMLDCGEASIYVLRFGLCLPAFRKVYFYARCRRS